MIAFADTAVAALLRSKLPSNYTVVIAPPEISKQALAKAAQKQGDEDVSNNINPNVPPNTKDTIGFPGLTVYRTGIARNTNQENMPMAFNGKMVDTATIDGIPQAVKNKEISMAVEYTVRAHARRQAEMNCIERELWFAGVYGRASIGIKGTNPVKYFNVLMWMEGIVYDQEVNNDTALIDTYGATATLRVETSWVKQTNVPLIQQIEIKFQSLQGVALTPELVDDFLIVPITD